MARVRIFRTPKHRKFDYIPRYWNPDKDDLSKRLERAERIKQGDAEAIKESIGAKFRGGGGGGREIRYLRSQQTKRSNKVLLFVVLTLVALTYLFLSVYLPRLIEMIEGNG